MNTIYIHIPFCIRKCFYCDFYSEEYAGIPDEFIDSLCMEIDLRCKELNVKEKKISAVFLGGGTPSLITPGQLEKIFKKLKKYFIIPKNAEVTMECNPGALSSEKLKEFRSLGINRLSVGIQSFNKKELKFLQRIHSPEEAENAVADAREAGFDNINIDLIFSIPGQTRKSLEYTLERALKLNIEHISAYSLIYEEGTPLFESFKKGLIKKTGEAEDAGLYELIIEKLNAAGFEQYEVSNFAKRGKKCRHNLNYWLCGEYLSFGPSAHGYIGNNRYWNISDIHKYGELISAGSLPVKSFERLTDRNRLFERIILGIRAEGINLKEIKDEFDIDLSTIMKSAFENWNSHNYIIIKNDKISLTRSGYPLCDEITSIILSKLD